MAVDNDPGRPQTPGMRVKTWKVLDYGSVPPGSAGVFFTCPCGVEAWMPVLGRALAQIGAGIVFDNDADGALPRTVQCRKCRRILTSNYPSQERARVR